MNKQEKTVNQQLPQERRNDILRRLRRKGRVVALELSREYDVSEDTIRRDLRDMAAEGLIKRVHGGALPLSGSSLSYKERASQPPQVKAALAKAAVKLIKDDHLIFLGSGTTNQEIARQLPHSLRATVVTTNLNAALILCEHPRVEAILIGGQLHKGEQMIVGAEALTQLSRIHADICFLGVCALHVEKGLMVTLSSEASLTRRMIAQSAEVAALVAVEKLNKLAPFAAAKLDQIDYLITNENDQDILQPFEEKGLRVIKTN